MLPMNKIAMNLSSIEPVSLNLMGKKQETHRQAPIRKIEKDIEI